MATTSSTRTAGNGGAGGMARLVATTVLGLGLLLGAAGGPRALAAAAPAPAIDCPLTTPGLCLGQWSSPAADAPAAGPATDCPLTTPGLCLGQWSSPPAGTAAGPPDPAAPAPTLRLP
jgi:hypothetical protein